MSVPDVGTPSAMPSDIARALFAASADARAVGKGSRNDFAHYDYASAEEILEHVRPLFAMHGLGVARLGWTPLRWLCTSDGEATHRVQSYFQITHMEKGTTWVGSVDWPVVVSKGRPLDKAEASALTDSLKYWLLGILLLPRADVEMDMRPDTLATALPTKGALRGSRTTEKPTLRG